MRNRTKTFSVRLSEKEFENLEKAIKKCGITKSEFVSKQPTDIYQKSDRQMNTINS